MNKIFKVVWSKSKECYVVVSEVAKNNGGKKKVLASVLAGLAMVGAGAVGTGVQAADSNSATTMNSSKQINVWATTPENNATARGSGSGTANANDVRESQYGDEISVAIGAKNVVRSTDTSNAGGGSSVALGNKNTLKGNRNVAVGTGNKTYGEDSIAVGSNVTVATGRGIAIGNDYQSSHTIAYGSSEPSETGVTGNAFALAIGNGAQADGRANHASGGIAIGQDVKATHNNTIAIGVKTNASGSNSTVVGSSAVASGSSSAAYGTQSNAKGTGAAAIGPGATTDGDGATALGRASSAKAESATALGRNAEATIAGGVALGFESKTTVAAGVQGYNPASDRTNKYSTQAGAVGTSTLAAVSIGEDSTKTRQLTGLAAGTADTDAVNVAQLKNVNLKYAADTGNSDVLLKDGTLTVNGDNDIISTSVESNGAIKVTAKKGANITTNADGKAVAPTTNGIATTDNVTQAINNSGWKVTSANNGGTTNGTTSEKVSPGDTVTFSAGKNIVLDQAGKQFTYSLNKDVDLTNGGSLTIGDTVMNNGGMSITGGPSVTKTGIDAGSKKITNVAKGTDDTDAVNYSQIKGLRTEVKAGTGITVTPTKGSDGHDIYTVSSNATGGTASTESVVKKAAASGDTNIADVSVAGGKNVNDPGAQYEVSVSKNAVKDAAREAVTVNNGGNTDNPITVTPTDDGAKHNTTYAVTFDGNKAAKQIPLTYKANGSGDKTVTLDKGLNFTNGTNTTAAIDNDGVVKFNLNDNVTLTNAGSLTVGGTTVNNGGLTITAPAGGTTSNVTLTQSGLDNGGNKIVNVKDGDVSATSKD
uniref:ESPR-type extended signal peptide-containing protein n=1 Tax=Veillonella sp. TaxID=1926307 RepID=UPI0025D2C659